MSPRHLTAQLAVAAFLAASLGDPAAFAQTTLPQTPATVAPVSPTPGAPSPARPTLPPGLSINVVNGQIQLQNPGGASNFATGQFGYTPNTFNAPLNVTPTPKNPPTVLGVNFATTPNALLLLIRNATQKAAGAPGYDQLTTAQKAAAVQASVAAALAGSGATADMLASALTSAVDQKIIKPEDAAALAWTVSVELGQKVGGAMFDRIYLGPQSGTTGLITGSISNNPVISVLTSLITAQGQTPAATTTPAAYDPCANVVAAYCG